MKKVLAAILALAMALSLCACGGGTTDNLLGTWEAKSATIDGSSFTMAEIEAMGDNSLSGFCVVFKEGGKAYIRAGGQDVLLDWEQDGSKIKVGVREFEYDGEKLTLEMNKNLVHLEKTSDSQEITSEDITKQDDTSWEEPSASPVAELEVPTKASDDFADIVEKSAKDTVSHLKAELETLKADINTFDSFQDNIEQIEAFYAKICNETKSLGIKMREYALAYGKSVMGSDKPSREKYEDMDVVYDSIYDDAGDEIYDIYDKVLDDMYDLFYDGILDDAYDSVAYKVWSSARSDEYDRWSDARSDVYDAWSEYRGDVYDFYSDMRSKLWDDDTAKAEKIITRFEEDISELKAEG